MTSLKFYCRYVPVVLGLILAAIVGASFQSTNEANAAVFNPEEPVCVIGWSKDHCAGELNSDNVREFPCVTENGDECRTIVVRDARFKFPVRSSTGSCGITADVLCDESQRLNGTLLIKGDFTFRGNESCRFRGCWDGDWELYGPDGVTVIATGRGGGPLGTGSHRVPTCPTSAACNPNCERCYEVQYIGSAAQGRWLVDLEGCLEGTVTAGHFAIGATICVSMSGVLTTAGDPNAPFNFGQWDYCGTSDGTLLVPCHQF